MLKHFQVLIFCIVMLTNTPGFAASEHSGVVMFNGVPVPGAAVTATLGNERFTAITDENGLYAFADLPDGLWAIQVEMRGFLKITREVTVADSAARSEWELMMLPFAEINAEIIPAVAIAPNANAEATANPRETVPSADTAPTGAFANLTSEELNQRAADGFLINGSVNNGAASPFGQFAAFGNNRSSRALYNGGVGVTLNNAVLDARSFSLTGQDTPKPAYSYAQGVITFGGPLRIPGLVRNGPNFFISYQRTQNRNATTQTGRMPTIGERNGDLSQTAGIVIPPNRISPQARALLDLYPLPNFEGDARYNYQIPVVGITHQDNVQFRLNRSLNAGNQISGNLDYQSARTDNGSLFGFVDRTEATATGGALSWFHRFEQRFSMNFRYQFNRTASRTTPHFANLINVSGNAGILGNNQEPVHWGPPNLSFFSGITGLSDGQYSFDRDQSHAVSATGFLNRGRHNFTFGTDFRSQQLNVLAQQEARGTFTFTGVAAGSDFAGFLLGTPDVSSIAFGNADKYFRGSNYAVHLADDWRISAGFTLNAGFRWEYEAPMTELYGRLVNLDIAPGFTSAVPVLGSQSALLRSDKRGVQPRISFAWRPLAASSIVVRGGYGIYRNTGVYPAIVAQMAQQSPLSRSVRVENSSAQPLSLAAGFNAFPTSIYNTFAVDPGFRVGYAHNWQLSVQRDLPAALQMVATYTAAKGAHLIQKLLPNTVPAGAAASCAACPTGFVYLGANGSSIRQAGQIQLRRRLQSGFAGNIQYTFSKATDDAALGAPGQGGAAIAQNWLDLEGERGPSNFDQRHLLNVQAQYTTGIGVAGGALLSGWKGTLLREWTFQSQLTVGSGLPLTPIYPVAVSGVTGSVRPGTTGISVYDAGDGRHLNPMAYRAPEPGQWGNAGRNSITGPRQFAMDASLGRTFIAGDRLNLDFRLDATNVLNHVTFPGWNTIVTGAQFGLPNRANAMRKVQATIRLRF